MSGTEDLLESVTIGGNIAMSDEESSLKLYMHIYKQIHYYDLCHMCKQW